MADNIKYDEPPKGLIYIRSVQNPYNVWDQPGYPVDYLRGAKISTYTYEKKRDQLYRFEKDRDGWWHIIPQTGGAITLEGNKNKNGVRLVIWDYDVNAANQKFLVQHQGNGRFKIFTSYGRVVTVANRSSANDSAVQTWDNHDGAWMEWNFIDYSTNKIYVPSTENSSTSATPDKARAKSGTLKDAIAGNEIVQKYVLNISASLFESDNSAKDFQRWMNGLSRNDQIKAYSDLLSSATQNRDKDAVIKIFKAVSEVSLKPGAGFADNMTGNLLKKQYNDAAARQNNPDIKKLLENIAKKLK